MKLNINYKKDLSNYGFPLTIEEYQYLLEFDKCMEE